MSVSLAEVRAVLHTSLSDPDLQVVIDREESWLASQIGALTGERTDTFTPGAGDTPLYLRRLTSSVVITDAGQTLAASEFLFTPSTGQIRRAVGYLSDPPRYQYVAGAWQGVVTVTYTPTDTAAVVKATIELIRSALDAGYESETMGDYSYTRGARPSRSGLARGVLLRRPAYSLRIRSAMEPA